MIDRKQALVERSALLRTRLQREAGAVRGSFGWPRAAVAAVGVAGVVRYAALAGRLLVYFRLARTAIGLVRSTLPRRIR